MTLPALRTVYADCTACLGTGWQPMKIGAEWVRWLCPRCITRAVSELQEDKK